MAQPCAGHALRRGRRNGLPLRCHAPALVRGVRQLKQATYAYIKSIESSPCCGTLHCRALPCASRRVATATKSASWASAAGWTRSEQPSPVNSAHSCCPLRLPADISGDVYLLPTCRWAGASAPAPASLLGAPAMTSTRMVVPCRSWRHAWLCVPPNSAIQPPTPTLPAPRCPGRRSAPAHWVCNGCPPPVQERVLPEPGPPRPHLLPEQPVQLVQASWSHVQHHVRGPGLAGNVPDALCHAW